MSPGADITCATENSRPLLYSSKRVRDWGLQHYLPACRGESTGKAAHREGWPYQVWFGITGALRGARTARSTGSAEAQGLSTGDEVSWRGGGIGVEYIGGAAVWSQSCGLGAHTPTRAGAAGWRRRRKGRET